MHRRHSRLSIGPLSSRPPCAARTTWHTLLICQTVVNGFFEFPFLRRSTRKSWKVRCARSVICEKTTIPIPAIHAYEISSENEIGMPYIVMDFAEGVPVSSIWHNEKIVDDHARRRIFEQITSYMSQLKSFQFEKIRMLKYDEASRTYVVGPYRRRLRTEPHTMEQCGPFATTHAFLSHLVQSLIDSACSPSRKSFYYLLRMAALSLPDSAYDGPPFVLSHPDFDSQNVLVDPITFQLTAFIDWDGVDVSPRLGGFARYPAWITRDWDPGCYWWNEPKVGGGLGTAEEDVIDDFASEAATSDGSEDDTDASGPESNVESAHVEEGAVSQLEENSTDASELRSNEDSGAGLVQQILSHKSLSPAQVAMEKLRIRKTKIRLLLITLVTRAPVTSKKNHQTLQRHRELYASIYASIDPENADITRQSHIYEALNIALHTPSLAYEITTKLCDDFWFNNSNGLGDIGRFTLMCALEGSEWLKIADSRAKSLNDSSAI
ncbi:hypothetical protein H0H81_000654 [Sphagnurus paluster]|uniref:Aminoglycoside phosphotransferase domain-containing protein n=1 Tax=Sphagnurus paluster TaxID=117069 RepID=A0A9P7K7U6_9AGAR|nr:hypothetical protein H0H81_000654 [Sphagnurus paluster]